MQAAFDEYATLIRGSNEKETLRAIHRFSQTQWKHFKEQAVAAFVVNHLQEKVVGINRETDQNRYAQSIEMGNQVALPNVC